MPKPPRALYILLLLLFAAALPAATQTLTGEGLRLAGSEGSFRAARYTPAGNLILLYDQGDGLRLLQTDAAAQNMVAEARLGAAGDTGVALTLDPAGNIYVAGTSTNGTLTGTAGAAFPAPADSSTNSFLAKFDPNLHLLFLTFLGTGRTAATGVAATADAAFVTGVIFDSTLPATSDAVAQVPANGSEGNGFVERFSPDGSALVYATYLTGAGGDTAPAAINADAGDAAYITGETSAPGYPTVNALQPSMLGTISGFLTKLTPAGDNFAFSTFIGGSGLTGLAVDPSTNTLLLTGNVALGQFPIATVAAPIANTPYQAFLRIAEDGTAVAASVLLAPGTQSFVVPGPNGDAWASGAMSVPLFAPGSPTENATGDSFLLHITAAGTIDESLRFGGEPITNAGLASLLSTVAAPAVNGASVTLPGTLAATADATLAPTQTFDLFETAATTALPGSLGAVLPTTCSGFSQCSGTAGLLATVSTATSTAALSLSTGDLPNLTLHNSGTAAAAGLAVTATGYTVASDCGSTLAAAANCGLALSGNGPGTLTVSSANASPLTVSLPATTRAPNPLAVSTSELDFGIVSAASAPTPRVVTLSNLTDTAQTFTSAADNAPTSPRYALTESGSSCGAPGGVHLLAAKGTCTVTLSLAASSSAADDGPLHAFWKLGTRDITLTGVTQAAALSVSASEIDFGVHAAGSPSPSPRFLYLSNSSDAPLAHIPVSLPPTSPFVAADSCPSSLPPAGVCAIELTYNQTNAPASDSFTLALDAGLTVLVTGQTLESVSNTLQAPPLAVTPAAISFLDPVPVTGISTETPTATLTNTGTAPVSLTVTAFGDFATDGGCTGTLPPGVSCRVGLQFTPSQSGTRAGLLAISAGPGYSLLTVPITGTGSALLPPNNGILALGTTPVGEPLVSWYRVAGSLPSLTAQVSGPTFGVLLVQDAGEGHGSPPPAEFASTATSACTNCWLGVEFLPQAVGASAATLTLRSVDGGAPYHLAVIGSGTAVEGLVLSPSAQDFGTVPVGSTSAPLTITLTNLLAPAAAAQITGITVAGDFQPAPNAAGTPQCSGALPMTASCPLALTFSPTAAGPRSGSLTVETSAGNVTAALSGSAVAGGGLALSPTGLNFVNGPGTSGTSAVLTLTNTGPAGLTVGAPQSSAPSFVPASHCSTLAPGGSCSILVSFTPGESYVSGTLTIPVTTTGTGSPVSTPYIVPLTASYTADNVGLLLQPTVADFGAAAAETLGTTRQFTLTNTSEEPETVSLAAAAGFPLSAPFGCTTLAPGATCAFSVSFLPETAGALTGSLLATATTPDGTSIGALGYLLGFGTGTGTLSLSSSAGDGDAPLNFGQVTSGSSTHQLLTLANTGAAPVTVRRVIVAPPFAASSNCGATLSPGDGCTVTITYAPLYEVSGSASPRPRSDADTLVIESNALSSPDEIDLSGLALPTASPGTINSPPFPTVILSSGALTFPNTAVGDLSAHRTLTVSNSGTAALHVTGVLTPADFEATSTCATVAPGASCTIDLAFAPDSANSPAAAVRSGSLEIQSDAPDALEFVSLLGMSVTAPLTLSPTALDFGTLDVGGAATLSVTATDTATLPVNLNAYSSTGDYTVSGGTCPAPGSVLPAGGSCTLTLTFAPTAGGARTGTLSLSSDATQSPLTVALTGTGATPQLGLSPAALTFPAAALGTSATLPVTVGNLGSTALSGLTVSVTGPGAAAFAVNAFSCPSAPLAGGSGCTLQVTFAPAATGAQAATLTVGSSDPFGPVSISLAGAGTPPPGFTLTTDGLAANTATVPAGLPASFALALTPEFGYAGSATLTCTPLGPAPYAACSLANPQLSLANGVQTASATISTVGGISSGSLWPLGFLCLSPAVLALRRRRGELPRHLCSAFLLLLATAACLGLSSCSSGNSSSGQGMTPPGSYGYRVTATSTAGAQVTSSVTLTVVVE